MTAKFKFKLVLLITIVTLFSVISYAQNRSLRVGTARIDITPAVNPDYPPSGKYDHEKMFMRAIVLDNGETRAVLMGGDISNMGEEIWSVVSPKIGEELDCPTDNIIISATHSHSARSAGPPPEGGKGPGSEQVIKAILDVVAQAKTNLQPAQIGFGTGQVYLNVNRNVISKDTRLWTQAANLEGSSDKTLAVLLFTDLEGIPIAGYMNYAMHPVNGYLTGITSADFPGAACRYIEKAFKDEMVMIHTQGACGDQNPRWLRAGTNAIASISGVEVTGFEMVREDIEGPLREKKVPYGELDHVVADNLERYMDALGVILGEEAIRVMTSIDKKESDVRIWGIQEVITLPGRTRTDEGREGKPGTYVEGPPVDDIRLGMLGIGDIALASINADIFNIYAQHLKKASPMTNTIMVTKSNGVAGSGYIAPDSDYGQNTFQVLNTRLQPGHAEQEIIGKYLSFINQYIEAGN
jgi:hypothetical protein